MEANAPPPTEALHTQVITAVLSRTKPKPWSQFFNAEAFEKPVQVQTAQVRTIANARTYGGNYVIMGASCTFFFLLLVAPFLAVAVTVCSTAAAAYCLDYKGAATKVQPRTAYGAFAACVGLLVVCTPLAEWLLLGAGFGAAACGLHAVLHDAPETFVSA
jgi:hypothetical protein